MALYVTKPTQSISVDVGYPVVIDITHADLGSHAVASTIEGAFVIDDNIMLGGSDAQPVFFGADGALLRGGDALVQVDERIISTETETVFTGPFDPIATITINGEVLNFTEGSIAAAEGSTGITIVTSGYISEAEMFGETSLLEALETKHFEMIYDGNIQLFEGRSNREVFKFKPDDSTGLPMDGDYLDLSDPRFTRVEVISGENSKISSIDDGRMIRGSSLVPELGGLTVNNTSSVELTIVCYAEGDEKGFVLTASEDVPLSKATVIKRRYRTI
ncbi:hypothetical protein [Alteromonas sp. C1M14]|uniref:hypothetical protein n=1 Tax=Alteromonas sp. C1M14 TaxID=2841567 RepID=UPI001C0A3D61|nr:hypothetical protein [Alteromonas sp. C1M14]MBU2978997.1 hypothetical protein [Alteromonas sp. C1M14]